MPTYCVCPCHVGGLPQHHVAPDIREPVSAVTACARCRNRHTIALVSEWPPSLTTPVLLPWMDVTDGEGDE